MQNSRFNPMPSGPYAQINPEMANQISQSPVFAAIANEIEHDRARQAMQWQYIYGIADTIAGQTTSPFILTIEQGTDFKCVAITASAFSYDAVNATTFPIPNALGSTAWAGRGLSVQVTDTNAGRDLTSGFIPLETFGTPGYGINFQNPYPFRYFFYRNNKIRFDIRNRDGALREHAFAIALLGFKTLTPQ